MADDQYKCLVVENHSNVKITVNYYKGWSPFCKFPTSSKTLQPTENHRYYHNESFKFDIFAHIDNRNEKKLLGPKNCNDIEVITINESLTCQRNTVNENGRQTIGRHINRENELPSGDLYEQLGLNMKEVRKMNANDLKKAVKTGFLKMMLIWHPDKPNGNKEIAEKIIHAKEILLNDEYRAQYHNHFDYQQGWFSLKRWKAIFLSECGSVKQLKAFWKRLGFLVFSSLLAVGGITCSVLTAGLGAPLFVTLGSIAGGALFGAGLQSSGECLKERSVIDGMDSEKWIKKALIGGAAGVFVGGASAGITAGIVGIGNAALSSGAVSIGKFIGMGAANGGIGGVIMSLISILSRKLVDKENIALKKVIIHALLGGLIGATAGIAAGAVTKPLVDSGSSAAAPTIEGDLVEQAFLRTTGQNTVKLLRLVGKKAAILASRVAIEKSYDAAYELVDSSAKKLDLTTLVSENENQDQELLHLQENEENSFGGEDVDGLQELIHEFYLTQENGENDDETNENEFAPKELKEKENNQRRERTKQSYNKVFEETSIDELQVGANDFLLSENNSNVKYGASAKTLTHSSQTERNFSSTVEIDFNQSNSTCTNNENFASKTQRRLIADETSQEQLTKKTIQYYFEGSWISKMIVTYYLNEGKVTEEVSGNGERVNISASAINVEVRFKVMRPFWGDVMTYDRFNKTWLKPYTPHIFRYQKAKNRTFTLSGNLRWEAVMGVSNEYGETKEMGFLSTNEIYCPQRNSTCSNNENFASKTQQHSILDDISQEQLTRKTIKYYSKGSWFSKMIVTYYLNERKVTEEVSGDGKRVNISSSATNIEVRFKVMRPFWGDVMKYDRFTNTWSKPYTPHIFRYEKATGRTFTLSGNLWWEAVMRVTDEYHEETNEMGEV